MADITEPNWDSLGDKELAAIIRSRTGEQVVPGRMAHATLVARAQRAFRQGATETKPAGAPETAAAPKSPQYNNPAAEARNNPAELAESASGNPLTEEHPEHRALGMETAATPAAKEKTAAQKR